MAAADLRPKPRRDGPPSSPPEGPVAAYLGLSFAVFLGLLPKATVSYLGGLRQRNSTLAVELSRAEEKIRQIRSRRREDCKANARVVEIFASHRSSWLLEERRLLARAGAAEGESAALRARVEELEASEREMRERLEARGRSVSEGGGVAEMEIAEMCVRMEMEACASSSMAGGWQIPHHPTLADLYRQNNFVPRRESRWKGGCEATGISVRLKQLEDELDGLERLDKIELSTIRKHAKRYQSLAAKIDDLCKKMASTSYTIKSQLSASFF